MEPRNVLAGNLANPRNLIIPETLNTVWILSNSDKLWAAGRRCRQILPCCVDCSFHYHHMSEGVPYL